MTTKMATSTKNSQNKSKNAQGNKAKNAQSNKPKNDENKSSKPKSSNQNQNNNKVKQQPSKQKAKGAQSQGSSLLNLRNATIILALLGIGISIFALYVEVMRENNPNYVALCDINSYISCSKVLTSKYSKGFGLVELVFSKDNILNQPNPVYGIIFYLLQALLALKATMTIALIQVTLSILANIGTVYLSYILAFVLKDACLVCISTYIVTFLLLVTSLLKLRQTSTMTTSKSSKKKKN